MTLERSVASWMAMDDETWLRHANPWSVWTRASVLRPRTTRSWASRGVLGERVWLNRDVVPVPAHHRRVPHVLNSLTASGSALVIFGLVDLAVWPTLTGALLIYCGKFWFLDRMVWLFEDMSARHAPYREWLY